MFLCNSLLFTPWNVYSHLTLNVTILLFCISSSKSWHSKMPHILLGYERELCIYFHLFFEIRENDLFLKSETKTTFICFSSLMSQNLLLNLLVCKLTEILILKSNELFCSMLNHIQTTGLFLTFAPNLKLYILLSMRLSLLVVGDHLALGKT